MKTLAPYFVAFFTVFSTIDLFADTLIGRPTENQLTGQWKFTVYAPGKSGGQYTDGQYVTDLDTGADFRVFCIDYGTLTSESYGSGAGQTYYASALADADANFYSNTQKTQLQSLFDHMYTKAYNDDYTPNNVLYASIFQLAVWEIVHETSGTLSLVSGSIGVWGFQSWNEDNQRWESNQNTYYDAETKKWVATGYQTQANKDYWTAYHEINKWFTAITNDSWESYGYDADHVDLTVYVAEGGRNVSQTLLGVAPQRPEGGVSITPEPATMLIMGLGLTGLAIARRPRRK